MPRALRYRNYGVYVTSETGSQHHLPHAHIKDRGGRIAGIFLITLTLYDQSAPVPQRLLEMIEQSQESLLQRWEELNADG